MVTAARVSHAEAARRLAATDPVLARLVEEVGPPRFRRSQETPFAALARSIVYQQLAGRAAAAIFGRLLGAVDGELRPDRLLSLADEELRGVGLSANKAAALRDLAGRSLAGEIPASRAAFARLSDDQIVERLSQVRGVGRWTAQMFLMFQLRRLDVWPTGDLGVRRGYGLAWAIPAPSAKDLEALGEPFRPYRSVAAWYCWRAVELYAGASASALTGSE